MIGSFDILDAERNWSMSLPGFSIEEIKCYKKPVRVSKPHIKNFKRNCLVGILALILFHFFFVVVFCCRL